MVKWLLEQGIDLNVSEEELSLLGKFIQELPEKALGLGIRVLLAALALFIGLQSIGCSDGLWKNLWPKPMQTGGWRSFWTL